MILTLDLGNTRISAGIFKNNKIIASKFFLYDNFPKMIKKWIKSGGWKLDKAYFCSVNPKKTPLLKKSIKTLYPTLKVIQVHNKDIPILNKYNNLQKLGVDRTLNVYTAGSLYGWPCLSIDVGTAITFDLGGPKSTFEGGLIFPSPELSLSAIQERAAKIENFPFSLPKNPKLTGLNTKDSILFGMSLGYRSLFEAVISEFQQYAKKKWKKRLKVVLTGGGLHHFNFKSNSSLKVDNHLTLKGLALLQKVPGTFSR